MEREKMYQKIIEESQQRIREQDDIIKSLEITVDGQDEAIKALREQIQTYQKTIKEEQKKHLQTISKKETLLKRLDQVSRDYERSRLIEHSHVQHAIKTEKQKRKVMGIAWWAILLFQITKTNVIMDDLHEIKNLVIQTISFLFSKEQQLFILLDQRQAIQSEIGAMICQWIATMITTGFIVITAGIMITKCIKYLSSAYRTHIWDEITKMEWYLSLAFVVMFAEEIRRIISVNMLVIMAGIHAIFIIVKSILRNKKCLS